MSEEIVERIEYPPGYRFLPTDEELVNPYLMNKAAGRPLPCHAIQEIDATELYSKPPRSLVTFSHREREWFFFIHEDENSNANRKKVRVVGNGNGNGNGCWKQTIDEYPICNTNENILAFKTHLTYFSATGKKTHWKMEEYRLRVTNAGCNTNKEFKCEGWALLKLIRGTDYSNSF